MKRDAKHGLWVFALVAMALGLQIQPTLTLGSGEVRASLSDLIGLLAAPAALWFAWKCRALWNRRDVWVAALLVAGATAVMTVSLIEAGMSSYGISGWALVKYAGWYVLVYYGLLGVLAGALAPEKALQCFLRVFVLVHALLVIAFIVAQWCGFAWPGSASPRMAGLMDNPNAFGLSLLCSLALVIGAGEQVFSHRPARFSVLLCALLAAGVLFTRSLAGLAGLAVIAVIALVAQRDFTRVFLVACLAALLYVLPWAGNSVARMAGLPVQALHDGIGRKISNPDKYAFSITARLESNARAIAMWRKDPALGAGLGAFYAKEKAAAEPGRQPLQIHNTLLWILAELGLAGALLFSALAVFAGATLVGAWRRLARVDLHASSVALAGIMVLGAWATMCMAHELLYQRIPWIILGSVFGLVLWRQPEDLKDSDSART